MNGDGKFLRETMISVLSEIPDKEVALFLSNGMDSRAVLYALLDAGKVPHAYTFAVDGINSGDLEGARKVAKSKSIRFTPVLLPRSLERLRADIYLLCGRYGCRKKTEYQCVWPLLYLYRSAEERYVAGGFGSQLLFPDGRNARVNWADDFNGWRQNLLKGGVDEKNQHEILCREHGKIRVWPFTNRSLVRHFWNKNLKDVHGTHVKAPIFEAFREEFEALPPKVQGYNIASHIREHFDLLLKTRMNANGHKSIVGVLNDVNKGVRIAHL